MFSAPILLTAALAACLWPTDQSREGALPGLSMDPQAPPMDTTLAPSADTWTWHSHPNDNFGTTADLRSGVSGYGRAFLRWDPQAIQDAVGSMTLLMARVEVTVQTSTDWSGSGGQVGLYRMTTDWTELGATDNCAIDAVPGNGHKDCSSATAWNLHDPAQAPWVVPATDSALLTNGQTGTVTFDVTVDVAAFLAGTANYGWAFKPTIDGAAADVRIGSREGTTRAMLVLTVSGDTGRPPIPDSLGLPPDSAALTVTQPGDTAVIYFRNILGIVFDDSTSGVTIRQVLERHEATIIGGGVRMYVVQVPDPGPTLQALDSVRTAIASESGVAYVLRMDLQDRVVPRGRWPNDGPGSSRQDWFGTTPGPGVRSRLTIRAPLAWGCETGTYDSSRARVGVLDLVFDASHFDLPAFSLSEPTSDLREQQILQNAVIRSHGFGVAGVLAAIGDNQQGVAGITWDADLFLLALGKGTAVQRVAVDRWARVMQEATDSGASVVVSSVGLGTSSDTALVRRYREGLSDFLTASTSNLFVMSLPQGNGGLDLSVTQVANTSDNTITALDRAVAQLYSMIPDQIILVAGTDLQGARWSESDFWIGATAIMAPATEITTLARVADFPTTGTRVATGTSYSAPFVAGVAAQLVGMDPSLMGGAVKDYIIRGAEEARFDPTTGSLKAPDPVPGAPEPTFQLDAYGALTLLARERSNTPVCGFPVFARDDAVFQVRLPGDTQTIPVPVPPGTDLANVSVAQGGRLLAVTDLTGGEEVVQFTPTGQAVGSPRPLLRRQFLERDTLDWTRFDANGDTWIILRRQDGTVDSLNAAALTFPNPAGPRFTAEVEGSPAGDWVAVRTIDAGTQTHRWDLLDFVERVPQNVATIVRSSPLDCTDCEGHFVPERLAGWSHDGQRALFAFPLADRSGGALVALRTRAQRIRVIAGAPNLPGQTDLIPDVIVKRPRFTADDAVLIWNELDLGSLCYRATRVAAAPAQVVGTRAPVDIQECDLGDAGPTIFNAPQATITTEAAAPRRSGRTPRPARQ